MAHRFVKPQPAPVQQNLVDVRASDAPVDAAYPLVAHDYRYAVNGAPVEVRRGGGGLQLALELHADLDGLEGVGGGYGAAGCDAAGYEGAAGWGRLC